MCTESVLSPEQVSKFQEDGFLLLPRHASLTEVEGLKHRMDELLQIFDPGTASLQFMHRHNTHA